MTAACGLSPILTWSCADESSPPYRRIPRRGLRDFCLVARDDLARAADASNVDRVNVGGAGFLCPLRTRRRRQYLWTSRPPAGSQDLHSSRPGLLFARSPPLTVPAPYDVWGPSVSPPRGARLASGPLRSRLPDFVGPLDTFSIYALELVFREPDRSGDAYKDAAFLFADFTVDARQGH